MDLLSALVLLLGLLQYVNASPSYFTGRDVHSNSNANSSVVSINNARLKKSGWHWVDTWTAMPQLTEPANLPPPPFVRPLYFFIYSISN